MARMQACVSCPVHPLIASVVPAAINTASPWLVAGVGDCSQRLSLRMVSSWRSNNAVVTTRAAVVSNRDWGAADIDGKVEGLGTRSDNGSLAKTSDDERSEQLAWTPPEPAVAPDAVINLELCVCCVLCVVTVGDCIRWELMCCDFLVGALAAATRPCTRRSGRRPGSARRS
jgi:hypothetical protein